YHRRCRGAEEARRLLRPDHRHGQCLAGLARPADRAGTQGAAARGRRAAGADRGAGVRTDLGTEGAVRLPDRLARRDRQHAGLRGPSRGGAADGALPDEPRQRSAGSSSGRQGPLPNRAGRRFLRADAPRASGALFRVMSNTRVSVRRIDNILDIQEPVMTAEAKVRGPASYFPSIEKTYGQPVAHWLAILEKNPGLRHGEQVALLKDAHGLGHGHANAL